MEMVTKVQQDWCAFENAHFHQSNVRQTASVRDTTSGRRKKSQLPAPLLNYFPPSAYLPTHLTISIHILSLKTQFHLPSTVHVSCLLSLTGCKNRALCSLLVQNTIKPLLRFGSRKSCSIPQQGECQNRMHLHGGLKRKY